MPNDTRDRRSPAAGRVLTALALAAALPALAACNTARETTGSIYPNDIRDRHPIMLTDGPRVLDVFVEGPTGLVSRSRQDVADFLGEYRTHGQGPMIAQVPSGVANGAETRRALDAIRGAAGGRLSVQAYDPADLTVASPIRLTFRRLQAKVAGQCGLWPQDLGVSDYGFTARNEQYWNFGCATQANLASQVAEPVDLVRGRRTGVPDTARRMYNIGQSRSGQDPSTVYKATGQTISSAIAQ